MDSKKRKRIRILGKILFILYVIFIIYFLLFSDWYGRMGRCGNTTTIWYCLKKSKDSGSTVSRWDSLQCSLIYLEMYSYLFHLDFSFRWEAGKEAFSVQHFTVLD